MTGAAFRMGVIPNDMSKNGYPSTYWSQNDVSLTLAVSSNSCAVNAHDAGETVSTSSGDYVPATVTQNYFAISLGHVPAKVCGSLLAQFGYQWLVDGLTEVCVGAAGTLNSCAYGIGATSGSSALSVSTFSKLNGKNISYWCLNQDTTMVSMTLFFPLASVQ
jgi:hypothetical protein